MSCFVKYDLIDIGLGLSIPNEYHGLVTLLGFAICNYTVVLRIEHRLMDQLNVRGQFERIPFAYKTGIPQLA
jgi:hypothetical protein